MRNADFHFRPRTTKYNGYSSYIWGQLPPENPGHKRKITDLLIPVLIHGMVLSHVAAIRRRKHGRKRDP
jgi:hypothetical protein